MKPYLIVIYGKNGCDRCARLLHDVKSILDSSELSEEFALDYRNLSTVEGMMAYALSETVNGQRLPALQVMKYDSGNGSYLKIPDTRPAVSGNGEGEFFEPVYLQIQTDYSSTGVALSGDDVMELLEIARAG